MAVALERADRVIVAELRAADVDAEWRARRVDAIESLVNRERVVGLLRIEAREPQLGPAVLDDVAQPEALIRPGVVPRQVPDLVHAAPRVVPVANVVVFAHAAILFGGRPMIRRASHDAITRGTRRVPQHDSLFMRPGIATRLRRTIAWMPNFATVSADFIDERA